MIDIYLKTNSQEIMNAVLLAAGVTDSEGNPIQAFYVDHIGSITKFTGYDEEGEPLQEYYPDWHTNLRGNFTEEQLAELEKISIQVPETPYRTWA